MDALIGFYVIITIITMVVAGSKGRSVVGWFLLSLLGSWISLIILLCLKSLKDCPEC